MIIRFLGEVIVKSVFSRKSTTASLVICLLISFLAYSDIAFCAKIKPAQPVKIIRRCGRGALIDAGTTKVLLLAGTPYEMGYQHGRLMKKQCRAIVRKTINIVEIAENSKKSEYGPAGLVQAWNRTQKFIDRRYINEMRGLADGAGIEFSKVCLANIFPELFHCSGFAFFGDATKNGELLHGRILDYMTTAGLQDHAVVIVAKPDGYNSFVNVGYAGFIGSVTGMNDKHIAIGEMGGSGQGNWDGMPMTFLIRKAMEQSDSLEEALNIFENTPRTCEYYYVISDAKIPDARGLACTPEKFEVFKPGVAYSLLPHAVEDAVLLSADERYEHLTQAVKKQYGKLNVKSALDLMNRPIAMKSCLHRVLFEPEKLDLWVANADTDINEPDFAACYQPYYQYSFENLRRLIPDSAPQGAEKVPAPPVDKVKTIISEPNDNANDDLRALVAKVGEGSARIKPADDNRMTRLLRNYALKSSEFNCDISEQFRQVGYRVYQVKFPSPAPGKISINNTVYCEYYRVSADHKRPAVIVLDILEGSQVIARLCARALVAGGCDACIVTLPYCGKRRPKDDETTLDINDSLKIFVNAAKQGVSDIRRAVRWLEAQPYIQSNKIGICGTSLGAIIGALAAGVDGEFPKAAFIMGGGDIASIVTTDAGEVRKIKKNLKQLKISHDQLQDIVKVIEPLNYAFRLRQTDVLMINARDDKIVPPSCSKELALACGTKIHWYPTTHTGMAGYLLPILQKIKVHFSEDKW